MKRKRERDTKPRLAEREREEGEVLLVSIASYIGLSQKVYFGMH